MKEWKTRYCRIHPMNAAPTKTPEIDAIPPKMTRTSTVIETWRAKSEGKSEPSLADDRTPATPDVDAPMAKAMTLYFSPLIPSEEAATSSSRIAAHDRPTFE